MSSERLSRLLRRIDLRIALWFTVIFAVSALVLFVLTFLSLYRTLLDEDHTELRHQLIQHYARFRSVSNQTTAVNQLAETLDGMGATAGRALFFRLATSENETVFAWGPTEWAQGFDLEQLESGEQPVTDRLIVLESGELDYRLEIKGIALSSDLALQIGISTANRDRLLGHFQSRFLIVFAVLLVVSAVGGSIFATRMLAPVGRLSEAIGRIVQTGELHSRLVTQEGSDDLQEMVRSFNHMLDRIEAVVDGMRDALDVVAHDLRTPMTRFRNIAEAALSGSEDPEKYQEALADAMEESEQILRMLDSMMDISEARSGVLTLHREHVDLGELVRGVIEVYTFVAEEAGMTIELDMPRRISLSADPARLRQVIGNLIDNAIKYGREGSAVQVRAERQPEFALIAVRNIGDGVPHSIHDRIWERLYRGPTAGRAAGLGLGLTLVRAITEAHEGRVEVESEEGQYAEFRVYMP